MRAKVLLATTVRWPSGARLAAAFAKTGCRVDALAPHGATLALSRFISSYHRYDPFVPIASLRRTINAFTPDLIVPCDDRALAQLLELADEGGDTRALITRSLGSLESYPDLISRSTFIESATDLKIRAPRTVSLANEPQLLSALEQFGYPAALKVDGSWGGSGVALVGSRDEAMAAFRQFSAAPPVLRSLARALLRSDAHHAIAVFRHDKPVLSLQRFVSGMPANSAFACWQGKVLATVHVDVIQAQEGNGPASVVRRVDDPDMQQAAERLAERYALSGLHGLDFMRDREGRAHVIECNPRATQTAALAFGEGHDLVAALVGAATQTHPLVRTAITPNPTIALFPQEWARDPASRWLREAHHDVPWDDPVVLRDGLGPPYSSGFMPKWLLAALRGRRSPFTSWKPSRPSL